MIYRICGLSFSYPGGPTVLDGVSLELERGEILSVIGESGSGKTSLIQAISCLLPPEGTGPGGGSACLPWERSRI